MSNVCLIEVLSSVTGLSGSVDRLPSRAEKQSMGSCDCSTIASGATKVFPCSIVVDRASKWSTGLVETRNRCNGGQMDFFDISSVHANDFGFHEVLRPLLLLISSLALIK